MPLPTRVINTEKLLERWGLTQSELFCLMVTKRLMPVYKTMGIDGWLHHEWNNFVEMLKGDDREKQVCAFSLPDVLKMETENEGLKSNSMHFLKGKEVMERWSISEPELVDLLETSLDPVDPTGDVLDLSDSEFLVQFGIVSGADLLFREDDIQRIEKEYDPAVKESVPDEKKLRPTQRHKLKCREIASEIWKKEPDMTIVDMALHDEIANVCEGKVYAEKTLRSWLKDLCPNRKPGRRPKK